MANRKASSSLGDLYLPGHGSILESFITFYTCKNSSCSEVGVSTWSQQSIPQRNKARASLSNHCCKLLLSKCIIVLRYLVDPTEKTWTTWFSLDMIISHIDPWLFYRHQTGLAQSWECAWAQPTTKGKDFHGYLTKYDKNQWNAQWTTRTRDRWIVRQRTLPRDNAWLQNYSWLFTSKYKPCFELKGQSIFQEW